MQTIQDQIRTYGMTTQDIQDQYFFHAGRVGHEMVVAGILSDCQEMLTCDIDMNEQIRKQLNVAKYILFEMIDRRQTETA